MGRHGQLDGSRVSVRARTAFRFGDFGLLVPRVSVVLSVEDDIKLEADLVLRRSSVSAPPRRTGVARRAR